MLSVKIVHRVFKYIVAAVLCNQPLCPAHIDEAPPFFLVQGYSFDDPMNVGLCENAAPDAVVSSTVGLFTGTPNMSA